MAIGAAVDKETLTKRDIGHGCSSRDSTRGSHTWRVRDVLQLRVSAQHSVLLNRRCGFVSGHRLSNLGFVTELPGLCTPLESRRSTIPPKMITDVNRYLIQRPFRK